MQSLPDLGQPLWFTIATIVIFLVIAGRYFLAAGLFYAVFYLWFPEKWKDRKISSREYSRHQFRREVGWSCVTATIFALSGTITAVLWQKGYTKLYMEVHQYPLWWLPSSLLLAMLLHETYYYWLHRWMYHPKVFRIVHKVHHDSNITSPWTAFSFHPLEGIIQALFLPLLLLVMPMHVYVLLLQLVFMTVSSVVNHLDIEIYPKRFNKHFIGRWLIGATHHSLHHRQFKYNYGLYFTFWDKWRQTESPVYHDTFGEKTSGSKRKED